VTGVRVVVIEDDADLREAICMMLRYEGFEPAGFSDGTEAIRRIESGLAADIILLDLMMPVMSGWEFCTRRAESPALSRVPVILITARQSITPTPVGISKVLLKPFDPDALQHAIVRVLADGPVPTSG
jgi:CheY-like chemotaxis protein